MLLLLLSMEKNTSFVCEKNQSENPINMYSYSKYLFDSIRSKYITYNNIKCVVYSILTFMVLMKGHKGNMASIIYNLLYKQIINNKNPALFIGSKKIKRDFIYVDDITNINMWIWNNNISGNF